MDYISVVQFAKQYGKKGSREYEKIRARVRAGIKRGTIESKYIEQKSKVLAIRKDTKI